jgi:hypothetical protein
MILGFIGFVFLGAVGYFAYNFGQCFCTFTRLDKLINKKIGGAAVLIAYVYLIYVNQTLVVDAYVNQTLVVDAFMKSMGG